MPTDTAELMPNKAELRALMKRRRAAIDNATRDKAALLLAESLALTDAWRRSDTIASFMSHGTEIDTQPIDALARAHNKIVVYPRVSASRTLTFHYWSPGESVERSAFGTREPSSQALSICPSKIGMTLVPLLACDLRGCRLGYGGGYYDQFLCQNNTFSMGLGFHWQLIRHVPTEDHDQPVRGFASDWGVTLF